MSTTQSSDTVAYQALSGIPKVDLASNIQVALKAGCRASSILKEVIILARGAGRLTPQEYFYYRLWDPEMPFAEKQRFVGKRAQHAMHVACNSEYWYCTTADKILFHTIMSGAGFPVPELLAVAAKNRSAGETPVIDEPAELAAFFRQPALYPLFIKPVGGKYSLSVISAEKYDVAADQVILLDGSAICRDKLASGLADGSGNLIQRRMKAAPVLATEFGLRLWSLRIIILLQPRGPVIHRAVVKIATGENPADNYWRSGNMLGTIDLETGRIGRVVRGAGRDLVANESHPDTGKALIGTGIPEWQQIRDIVREAALIFAGIRTQSWDIALTDRGPVFLEANYGGDLNLAQLASASGVLDRAYKEHLEQCGYRFKQARQNR